VTAAGEETAKNAVSKNGYFERQQLIIKYLFCYGLPRQGHAMEIGISFNYFIGRWGRILLGLINMIRPAYISSRIFGFSRLHTALAARSLRNFVRGHHSMFFCSAAVRYPIKGSTARSY